MKKYVASLRENFLRKWGTLALYKLKRLILHAQRRIKYDPGLIHKERKWSCLTHQGSPTDHNKPVRPDGEYSAFSAVPSLSSEKNEIQPHSMMIQVITLKKSAHSPWLWATVRNWRGLFELCGWCSSVVLHWWDATQSWNMKSLTRKYPAKTPNLIYFVIYRPKGEDTWRQTGLC